MRVEYGDVILGWVLTPTGWAKVNPDETSEP